MPMYVLHGFRWPRTAIREFIILNNIDDAAPDYLMATTTPEALKEAFIKKFPHIMAQVPNVQFVEQHDPEKPATQTFAFVADVVFESDQSIDIDVARQHGPKPAEWDAFMDLKGALNELARMFYPDLPDFTIGWWVHRSILSCIFARRWDQRVLRNIR